jgi:hypothetical protein
MAAYGGMEVYFHPFLTSVIALPPGKGALVLTEQVSGWASKLVRTLLEDIKISQFCCKSNHDSSVVQTVA